MDEFTFLTSDIDWTVFANIHLVNTLAAVGLGFSNQSIRDMSIENYMELVEQGFLDGGVARV